MSHSKKVVDAPSAKLGRLEIIWASLVIVGVLVGAVVLLFALGYHSYTIKVKQMMLDDTRASLSTALDDLQSGQFPSHPGNSPDYGIYGGRYVYGNTHTALVNGTNYQFALSVDLHTGLSDGWLAVTTNRVFIWVDARDKLKIIPDNYKVSYWSSGY